MCQCRALAGLRHSCWHAIRPKGLSHPQCDRSEVAEDREIQDRVLVLGKEVKRSEIKSSGHGSPQMLPRPSASPNLEEAVAEKAMHLEEDTDELYRHIPLVGQSIKDPNWFEVGLHDIVGRDLEESTLGEYKLSLKPPEAFGEAAVTTEGSTRYSTAVAGEFGAELLTITPELWRYAQYARVRGVMENHPFLSKLSKAP